MTYKSVTDLVASGGSAVTKRVTAGLLNTHCILCGSAFAVSRAGKLYCSSRCKQFGFNHKSKISDALATQSRGISPTPEIFYLEDFAAYNDGQRHLKRYKELTKKKQAWEAANQEIVFKQRYGIDVSPYLWEQLTSRKLIESEEMELDEAESTLDEALFPMNLRELSLEQWSFLKSLNADLDELSFFGLVSAIGIEFIQQLSFKTNVEKPPEWLVIKNRFINHCNLIATGVIRFEKKDG